MYQTHHEGKYVNVKILYSSFLHMVYICTKGCHLDLKNAVNSSKLYSIHTLNTAYYTVIMHKNLANQSNAWNLCLT